MERADSSGTSKRHPDGVESEEATFNAERVWSLLSQVGVDRSEGILSLPMSNAWPERGASAV